jgi:hypothetical protein
MDPSFFQTIMGHTFYEGTVPRIAKALERIAIALEEANKKAAATPAAQDNTNNSKEAQS